MPKRDLVGTVQVLLRTERLKIDAAQLENQALGVEDAVRVRLDAEVEEIVRRIGLVLPREVYLEALEAPGGDEREN